ncbi:hypothetical protein [Streptomyces hokutonensis]|uniref:LexA family protein n=1 Tax=Streptomyces hokutonensis TaxID=1306990 RepID=UPI003699D59F
MREAADRQGCPPSMREIGQAVHLSSNSSVAHQLTALESKDASGPGGRQERGAGRRTARRSGAGR